MLPVRGCPLADLHRKTDIAKPTLLRLMQSLLDHGLLMPADKRHLLRGSRDA